MTPNQARFAELYRAYLKQAVKAQPADYAFIAGREDEVADKMLAAIPRRSYNKDGFAFKYTCKTLHIPYTYAAINNFWNS